MTRSVCVGGVAAFWVAALAGASIAAPTVERETIGTSPAGATIEVITIADRGAGTPDPGDRPAIAIIAGVQGHHQIGTIVAEALAGRFADEHAEALAGRTLYVIPRLNPDGLARFRSADDPAALSGRAPASRDADRDRRFDEDPPNDLNGDGVITMMRVPAPVDAYGLRATHVIDGDDPRIMREPKDDERATHAVMIEGVDDDGDGRFNEDGWGGTGGGGVDLDMHFPTHWPEHTDGAGMFPLDRPEAQAVVEWLQSRTNIAAVIVMGPHDTIVSTPKSGQYGPAGRVPKGIEKGDSAVYEMAAESFKEITGITKTEAGPDRDGSLLQWCYADLGVYAFGTPVWVRPDLVESDGSDDKGGEDETEQEAGGPTPEAIEAADRADLADRGVGQVFIDYLYMTADERAFTQAEMEAMSEAELETLMTQYSELPEDVQSRLTVIQNGDEDPGPSEEFIAAMGEGEAPEPAKEQKSRGDSPDAKWLAWIDENAPEGFVEWESYDHPQLGTVEIGGFVPGVRVNPPASMHETLTQQQAAFAASVLEMLPSMDVEGPIVERVGSGVWRVSITLRNAGTLPTKSAIGVKARRLPGIVCVLDPDQEVDTGNIISGSRVVRFAKIDGRGESERAEWLVVAESGDSMDLEVRSPLFGTARYELTMEEN